MTVFGRLFKARDKPRNSLNGSGYSFFFGNTASGKAVNERSAMQMSAVYACVRILAEAIASLPLHFYQYNDTGGKEKALDHPLYNLLHDEPNPEMSALSFRATLMTHLLLWGNAYAQVIRNGRAEAAALYPLMPDRMTVDRDSAGRIFYEYLRADSDARTLGRKSIVQFAPEDSFSFSRRAVTNCLRNKRQLSFTTRLANLPLVIQEMIFGNQIDDNGVLIRSANDKPGYFAVGFMSEKANGKYRFVWLYKVRAKPVTESYATKEGTTITRQTGEVEWTAIKRTSDGRYQAIADEGEGGFDSSKAATFLESVYTPTFTPEEDGP